MYHTTAHQALTLLALTAARLEACINETTAVAAQRARRSITPPKTRSSSRPDEHKTGIIKDS